MWSVEGAHHCHQLAFVSTSEPHFPSCWKAPTIAVSGHGLSAGSVSWSNLGKEKHTDAFQFGSLPHCTLDLSPTTAASAWLRGYWTAVRGWEGAAEHREECRNNFIHFSQHGEQEQQLHTHMTKCSKNPALTLTQLSTTLTYLSL